MCLWPRRLWVVSMWLWGPEQRLYFCPKILPRQKTLQRNWVSCSFGAVIVPHRRGVIPKLAEWGRRPPHLQEIFVNLHEKSKSGIQKQDNCEYWLTFYVCHSRIVTTRTFLVQNIFLSEERGHFSVLTAKVIDYLGGSKTCTFLSLFLWIAEKSLLLLNNVLLRNFWKGFCDMTVQPTLVRYNYMFCINVGVSNLMGS